MAEVVSFWNTVCSKKGSVTWICHTPVLSLWTEKVSGFFLAAVQTKWDSTFRMVSDTLDIVFMTIEDKGRD